tara:strand:- start:1708 stop:2217 length:510 start_codon:yes stop_codon:yes gene_type:complete
MMKKNCLSILTLTFCFGFFTKCERDDICIEGTQGTPNLIVRFFDSDNTSELKKVPFLLINDLNSPNEEYLNRYIFGADSIVIQLNETKDFTQLKFFYDWGSENQNIDTLKFNHNRIDEYINRACGFRGQFVLKEKAIEGIGTLDSWVKSFKVIKDSISNENSMHLAIYH